MTPLHHEPHFTFRFAQDRIILRFHLEEVEAGQRVSVFKSDPGTGMQMSLLTTATVGEGGWADLQKPIIVAGWGRGYSGVGAKSYSQKLRSFTWCLLRLSLIWRRFEFGNDPLDHIKAGLTPQPARY